MHSRSCNLNYRLFSLPYYPWVRACSQQPTKQTSIELPILNNRVRVKLLALLPAHDFSKIVRMMMGLSGFGMGSVMCFPSFVSSVMVPAILFADTGAGAGAGAGSAGSCFFAGGVGEEDVFLSVLLMVVVLLGLEVVVSVAVRFQC